MKQSENGQLGGLLISHGMTQKDAWMDIITEVCVCVCVCVNASTTSAVCLRFGVTEELTDLQKWVLRLT